MKIGRFTQLTMLACLILAAAPALAGGFEFQKHGFYLIDVMILVALAATFLKGPARAFLEKRHETARLEMDEAMSVKTTSEARLQKYESALSNLNNEVAELNEAFRQDGEREAARITQEGEDAAEKIRRDSLETLSREGTQLKNDIERSVATQALARAETMIQSRLDAQTHQALIETFIADLESRDELGSFTG
jgi:F-type H+-transporting ATPase subunit b